MAQKKRQRRSVMKQPTTAAGAGLSLTSIVPFLPPHWQPIGYGVAALLGVAVPILAQYASRASDPAGAGD